MRLLFVSHSAGLLGAERSLLEMVNDARLAGHEVIVSVPSQGPLVDLLRETGAQVRLCPTYQWMGRRHNTAVGLLRTLQARLAVSKHAHFQREINPDWVITNTSVIPSAAWAAKANRIPHVWLVRESILTNPNLKSFLPKRAIAHSLFANSKVVCAVSDFVESQIHDADGSVNLQRTERLWPVRDLQRTPDAKSLLLQAATMWTERGTLRLLLPGSISVEKGQFLAVDAMEIVRQREIRVQLIIIGSGPGLVVKQLKDHVEARGLSDSVRVLPWTDNLSGMYIAADAVVMVSKNEAFGRTTAESLVHGTPVIGFEAGATPEILASGGGLLVHGLTAAALAEAIIDFASWEDSKRKQMRASAREAGQRLLLQPSQFDTLIAALSVNGEGYTEPRRSSKRCNDAV